MLCMCEALKWSLCVIHAGLFWFIICKFVKLALWKWNVMPLMGHPYTGGDLSYAFMFSTLCIRERRSQTAKHCPALTFCWKLFDGVCLRSSTHNSSLGIHSFIHSCFLLPWPAGKTPQVTKKSLTYVQTHTHTHTYTYSFGTTGKIPVLSGYCGTLELSKLHHNPSHGSGHSVRTQFTVCLSTIYWPCPDCGLKNQRAGVLSGLTNKKTQHIPLKMVGYKDWSDSEWKSSQSPEKNFERPP